MLCMLADDARKPHMAMIVPVERCDISHSVWPWLAFGHILLPPLALPPFFHCNRVYVSNIGINIRQLFFSAPTTQESQPLSCDMEWMKQQYNKQYENWVPWLEDKYLAWFGENKSSYIVKGK
jgi:hypothetical protein